ncbi:MAG: LacI family DNA-binding transcriptional regulator, partial [Defluviitoga tunisiensis]
MPTIDEVAKLAGVSIATVSRVLNSKNTVSEKTREKVLKV